MLIVLFIIFLVLIKTGLFLFKLNKSSNSSILLSSSFLSDAEILGYWLIAIGCTLELIVLIAIICMSIDLSRLKISDNKILMYEQENNNIQVQISEIVTNYMNYEQNTYNKTLDNIDMKNTDIVLLTQLYPDLKSNEIVNTQIQIYKQNNEKIKELKEEKLDHQVAKWWLYFGKIEEK